MDRLPSAVIEDENDEVEAIVPEALGARPLAEPAAGSRSSSATGSCRRAGGGFEAVPGAVELLEFSHRERAHRLPAVGLHGAGPLDRLRRRRRPGLRERAADVCEETLARIDPRGPASTASSIGEVGALNDLDRHEDALEVAQAGPRGAGRGGARTPTTTTACSEHAAAAGTPRGGAEGGAARARTRSENGTFAYARRQKRTRALLDLGRVEEAREEHLPLEIALREPEVPRVVGAQHAVAGRGGQVRERLGARRRAERDGRRPRPRRARVRRRRRRGDPRAAGAWARGAEHRPARAGVRCGRSRRGCATPPGWTSGSRPWRRRSSTPRRRPRSWVTTPEAWVEALLAEPGETSDPERDVERLLAAAPPLAGLTARGRGARLGVALPRPPGRRARARPRLRRRAARQHGRAARLRAQPDRRG